ncbi:MAG: CapA family protein [Anaerococcus obesiensis]
MKKIKRILSVILIFFLAISFTSCKKNEDKTDSNSNIAENIIIKERKKSNDDSSDSNNKKKNISKIEKKDSNTNDSDSKVEKINIKAFGDIMAHMGQVNYAKNYGKGNYDFSRQFEYIKEFVSDSDLAIGNFETSINSDKQPSGFPQFTSPAEYLKDIKDAGFDLLSTANNHTLDSEEKESMIQWKP